MGIENQILLKENPQPGILRLIMNDPNRKNALSENMIDALTDTIVSSSEDKSIKVIIIAANGNVFSSGHDLKELTLARDHEDDGNSYFMKLFGVCSSLMQSIVDCPKPVIAEVNGVATAAGCQLVASCDLAISSDNSKFATPEGKLGIIPGGGATVRLPRIIGKGWGMEMLLMGDAIDAERAFQIGLVTRLVEPKKLIPELISMAEKLSKFAPFVPRTMKAMVHFGMEASLSSALMMEKYAQGSLVQTDDKEEGIKAFLEKRDPNFKGS